MWVLVGQEAELGQRDESRSDGRVDLVFQPGTKGRLPAETWCLVPFLPFVWAVFGLHLGCSFPSCVAYIGVLRAISSATMPDQ